MRKPKVEFEQVVQASAQVFIRNGYVRTQVQDIADELGVAKGTVYLYAESKESLLGAAIRYADGHDPLPERADLPLRAEGISEVAEMVRSRLSVEIGTLVLHQTKPGSVDLAALVVDLYQRLARHRIAIKLVDRCASEIPELARVWFGEGRGDQVDALEALLTEGHQRGDLAVPGPPAFIARTIVELVALWSVHCQFDSRTDGLDDSTIAPVLGEFIARAVRP
jgi:AcrR family transcriptional regulator